MEDTRVLKSKDSEATSSKHRQHFTASKTDTTRTPTHRTIVTAKPSDVGAFPFHTHL